MVGSSTRLLLPRASHLSHGVVTVFLDGCTSCLLYMSFSTIIKHHEGRNLLTDIVSLMHRARLGTESYLLMNLLLGGWIRNRLSTSIIHSEQLKGSPSPS